MVPVRKPLPSGLYGTKPMPGFSRVGQHLVFGPAREHRILALEGRDGLKRCARRIVPAAASDMPKCFTLPASMSSLTAPATSSIGTFWIDAVLVVEVDGLNAGAVAVIPPRPA